MQKVHTGETEGTLFKNCIKRNEGLDLKTPIWAFEERKVLVLLGPLGLKLIGTSC